MKKIFRNRKKEKKEKKKVFNFRDYRNSCFLQIISIIY